VAAFAAYAPAWMRFLVVRYWWRLLVGLLVVPLQMSLIQLAKSYNNDW